MTGRHCFALDLKDDPELISRYRQYHQTDNVWPEITESISQAGIVEMEIYLVGNRLFMVMDVNQRFSFAAKAESDSSNEAVQKWESLMATFQQALPWATGDEKWLLMENIFTL